MGKRIYNLQHFKDLAITKGGECLSDEYISCVKKLTFKCNKGHVWETKPYYLVNNGSWCPKCSKTAKDDIELFKQIAIDRGGQCLSEIYVNCTTKLKFICSEKHVWDAKPHDVKFSKSWCPVCSNSVKLTIGKMNEIAEERGGKCLSTKYINSHSKLEWECELGHTWWAKPYLIKNTNTWCPECKESHGERIVNSFLIKQGIKFERQKTFDDCIGKKQKLPFDFYLVDYNILIEYDGKQHFQPVNFYGISHKKAKKCFDALQKNDKIKNKYCEKNNIKLIRIPYTVQNIDVYLLNELDGVMELVS